MNTFGNRFRLTSFGESHGEAIGGVIDGCMPGLRIDYSLISKEMARRHIGNDSTMRREADEVEFLSGIYEGVTLGTPIAFIIRNRDTHSEDYVQMEILLRPGHADYTTLCRYGRRDHRGGGRASGRETAVRVVCGAFAKMLLRERGIRVAAEARYSEPTENDSTGGVIECSVTGVPAGIGDPIFDKLNARLAAAMMSIPSAIGFEMGAGFEAATMSGSEFRDKWRGGGSFETETNHCGGVQGGISNGMPIIFKTAFHPVVTIPQPTDCVDIYGDLHRITPQGRHDRCHLPRTVVVVEAMAAMVIADYISGDDRSGIY